MPSGGEPYASQGSISVVLLKELAYYGATANCQEKAGAGENFQMRPETGMSLQEGERGNGETFFLSAQPGG